MGETELKPIEKRLIVFITQVEWKNLFIKLTYKKWEISQKLGDDNGNTQPANDYDSLYTTLSKEKFSLRNKSSLKYIA
jgi:hypothetical protein